ncbi:MAG: hypothetical protein AAGA70_13935 [Pseudomonadota bacterium]
MRKQLLGVGFVAAAFLVSGCVMGSGTTSFSPPRVAGSTPIRLAAGTDSAAVAAQLQGLGLTITRQGASFVEATGGGESKLVDCGTLRQSAFGNRSEIPGTAQISTFYTSDEPLEIIVREFAYRSVVRIDIDGQTAMLNETHRVAARWQTGDGQEFAPEQHTIGLGESVIFADGIECATTGRISQTLR